LESRFQTFPDLCSIISANTDSSLKQFAEHEGDICIWIKHTGSKSTFQVVKSSLMLQAKVQHVWGTCNALLHMVRHTETA